MRTVAEVKKLILHAAKLSAAAYPINCGRHNQWSHYARKNLANVRPYSNKYAGFFTGTEPGRVWFSFPGSNDQDD